MFAIIGIDMYVCIYRYRRYLFRSVCLVRHVCMYRYRRCGVYIHVYMPSEGMCAFIGVDICAYTYISTEDGMYI